MKPKQKKQKKPLNKWKLTAIISLVVNGLVAILLAVGLSQPKTEKTSAYGVGGDYYIYENRSDIQPSDISYYSYDFTTWTYNTFHDGDIPYYSVEYYVPSGIGADYFDTDLFINHIVVNFDYVHYYPSGVSTYDYWLNKVYLYPYGSDQQWRLVYSADFTQRGVVNSISRMSLGDSGNPYAFLTNSAPQSVLSFLNDIFINKGTNEVIYDYDIRDNWSPNKYISLVTDSVGLLFDSPSAISGSTINGIKGVSWSNPIYRGDNKSQLGYLEIPLLFTSHGENFIGLRLYYDVVMNYVDKNNEIQTFSYGSSANLHDFHYTFVYMSYVYELSNSFGSAKYSWKEKVVCALPIYRSLTSYIEDDIWVRNFIYEVYQPYNWLHEDYKSIGVYEASTPYLNRVGFSEPMNTRSLAINNMTIRDILEFDMTQNDYGINTNGYVTIGNVFVLISSAFSSVMPLLSVVIVPGITIGMLLFIPIILTIIIVVIKLVKR